MNLECLNSIITDNLAIQIDLTQLKSWNLNTGFTAFSLTKWAGAVSNNINLIDFGLTEFDNGRTNIMWSGITLTPTDTLFSMYRIGYNIVKNPSSGNTSGYTATTTYSGYTISAVTTTSATTGNYFELRGGYLQGFFKLQDYKFELLPSRYNNGITIETLVKLEPNSQGIFYMMGLRAEDKYNPFFSGETTTGGTLGNVNNFNNMTGTGVTTISGVSTSEGNDLNAFIPVEINKKSFNTWETRQRLEYKEFPPIENIKGNAIAFFLTAEKHLGYKYIDNDGLIVQNISPSPITATGFTMIAIGYTPSTIINDPDLFKCAPQRTGKLIFYINGRAQWILREFPEYFFKGLKNEREKQIGVPYSISWGGGSFGLRHSWHYDYQKYGLYTGQNTAYIDSNFFVEADPIPTECYTPPTGSTYLRGLAFSADSTTFITIDKCDPTIHHPLTVMRVEYTGTTGNTGATASTYFIKFNHPITVLSNRDYVINLSIFNQGFFNANAFFNRASIGIFGTTDIDILDEVQYSYPLTSADLFMINNSKLHPFPDRQEYQYIYLNNLSYYGATGFPAINGSPIIDQLPFLYNFSLLQGSLVTGANAWKPLSLKFRTAENSGKQTIHIGILLRSSKEFILNTPLYIKDFTYKGADILHQDPRKSGLLIEENFDSSFIGGIQKLRVYNQGLSPAEILHNALVEAKLNQALNIKVNKGGRLIYG
jgi:hypothetical protein